MKKYEVIVVGKAFFTPMTSSPTGEPTINVGASKLIRIRAWTFRVQAPDEEAAGILAADMATARAYEEYGGGPLWACLPIAAMEVE